MRVYAPKQGQLRIRLYLLNPVRVAAIRTVIGEANKSSVLGRAQVR